MQTRVNIVPDFCNTKRVYLVFCGPAFVSLSFLTKHDIIIFYHFCCYAVCFQRKLISYFVNCQFKCFWDQFSNLQQRSVNTMQSLPKSVFNNDSKNKNQITFKRFENWIFLWFIRVLVQHLEEKIIARFSV